MFTFSVAAQSPARLPPSIGHQQSPAAATLPPTVTPEPAEIRQGGSSASAGSSAHSNPDWLKDLKKNFKKEIIGKCSMKVQEAVENNHDVKDAREIKAVRNEIMNTVVGHVVKIFGGVSRPRISEMRELTVEMQFTYPAMFRDDDTRTGYGLGGTRGNDGLAAHLLDRIRKVDNLSKTVGSKEPVAGGSGSDFAPKRKGKRKLIYGIYLTVSFYDL